MSETNHYYGVILAGGIGSRFWPISREKLPKQFLDFTKEGKSFLRLTYDRLASVIPEENILVISLTRYRSIVKELIPELRNENLILEPYNRNTAPAITYATYTLLSRDPEAVVVTTPADHVVGDDKLYAATVLRSLVRAARSEALITLGIVPTRPDPNFGYIQAPGDFTDDHNIKIKTFTEKPDAEIARVFVESGEFLWNSGIFVWRADVISRELERYAPEITRLWTGWENVMGTPEETAFVQKIYASDCPRISIDYAVMEKTELAWVYPAKFEWADIGNWDSLYDHLSRHDGSGNASNLVGKGLLHDCCNDIIYSGKKGKLTAIKGLENFIVIDTDDVLLICPREDDEFKGLLSELALPEYSDYR